MSEMAPSDQDRVEHHLLRRQPLHAIKAYRQATGAGLAEAKEAVGRIEARLREQHPERFKGGLPGGCLLLALAAVFFSLLVPVSVAAQEDAEEPASLVPS